MSKETPNQQRAGYAAELLTGSRHYDSDDQVGAQDLLSDLMHFCRAKGFDFTDVLRRATDNFNAEVTDDELDGRSA